MKHITLLITLFLFQYFRGCAPEDEYTTTQIEGTIVQIDEQPLTGITVELTIGENRFTAETDENGFYILEDIQPGLGFITFSDGTQTVYQERIAVYEGKTQKVHYKLTTPLQEAFLQLDSKEVSLNNRQQTVALPIKSNQPYTLAHSAEWIHSEKRLPGSSGITTVTVEANETTAERTAELFIRTDNNETYILTLKQQAGPVLKLLNSENPADPSAFIRQGVSFHFSRPVSFVKLESPHTETNTIQVTDSNNKQTLCLSNFPMLLFQKCNYKLTVSDSDGTELSVDFSQKLYSGEFISKYGEELLFTSNPACGWSIGTSAQIISLPEMRTISTIKSEPSYDCWSYHSSDETMRAFRKDPDSKEYMMDIYETATGKLLQTSPFAFSTKHRLLQVAFANNGWGVGISDQNIFTINPKNNHPESLTGYKPYRKSFAQTLTTTSVKSCMNGTGFILHGHNPVNQILYIDAETQELRKIADAPHSQLCVVAREAPFVAVSNGKEIQCIHLHQPLKKNFQAPVDFYEMMLIESGKEVTHIVLFANQSLYILNCSDESFRKIDIPYHNIHCTSVPHSSNYLSINRYNQSENRYYNYLFPTSLFTY